MGNKYYPSFTITTFATIFDKEVGAKIQTTAFGSMSIIDYEKLLDIYHKALACAKELEKEFVHKE